MIRATVKGDILVALLQGALGWLIFWILGVSFPLLWGASMAVLSLVPAIAAALVWGPVALYFLVTGATWCSVVLVIYSAFIIGLADNVLRPIVVGNDTRMPNYIVLISTLGGIEMFGLNGFVIGPVIAATFITTWDIYSATRQETNMEQKFRENRQNAEAPSGPQSATREMQ